MKKLMILVLSLALCAISNQSKASSKTLYCRSQDQVNQINAAQNNNDWNKVVSSAAGVGDRCAESQNDDTCFRYHEDNDVWTSDKTRCTYPVTIKSWEKYQYALTH